MKEDQSQRHIYVSLDGDAAPYVIIPRGQIAQVRRLFLRHGVAHKVTKGSQAAFTVINLGKDADVRRVQALLDGVP